MNDFRSPLTRLLSMGLVVLVVILATTICWVALSAKRESVNQQLQERTLAFFPTVAGCHTVIVQVLKSTQPIVDIQLLQRSFVSDPVSWFVGASKPIQNGIEFDIDVGVNGRAAAYIIVASTTLRDDSGRTYKVLFGTGTVLEPITTFSGVPQDIAYGVIFTGKRPQLPLRKIGTFVMTAAPCHNASMRR